MPQVVLITGCRSGFGLLLAVAAAQAGHTVYAGLRDLGTAGDLRAAAAAAGVTVHLLQLDVNNEAERRAAVQRVEDEQGRIDVLINNAGVALGGFVEMVSEAELRQIIETNLISAHALTRLVLPGMRSRRAGKVLFLSSNSGLVAMPGLGAYAASKFALEGLAEALRHELRPFGVSIVLIEPGPYKTDIWGRNRALCAAASQPPADYAPYLRHIDDRARQLVERVAEDPQIVVRYTLGLLQQRRPALRHVLGISAKARVWLKRFLPFGVLEAIIARFMRA